MTRLRADKQGSGSYAEIVQYVQAVLEDNFVPNEDRQTWTDPYGRSARAITQSVLHRLGVDFDAEGTAE